MRAIVLGAGMVGSVMAADLAADHDFAVTLADLREDALARAGDRIRAAARREVRTQVADLANPRELSRLIAPFDIVLGALSSRIGLAVMRAVIEAGKHYCDISFMAEDALELDALAKERGVTALFDMGVAPGMSNLLLAHAAAELDECREAAIYVGGLPRERRWPYQYKAAFAPSDVIEEYTRPSRLVENGRVVVRPALSEPELLDFAGVGTLEAFNTDGLRSLVATHGPGSDKPIPTMREKTMRYPGHIELMRVLRETGLFSQEPVRVGNASVVPLELTSRLLFPKWTYEPLEEDLTVMRVIAEGTLDGAPTRITWDVLDHLDRATGFTSMSRTTAFPATIAARLIAGGKIATRGVLAPEHLAPLPGVVQHLIDEHARRGIRYARRAERIESP